MSVTTDQYLLSVSDVIAKANSLYSGSATTLNGAIALFATNGVFPVNMFRFHGLEMVALNGGGPASGSAYVFLSVADLIKEANTLYGSVTTMQQALTAFITNGLYLIEAFLYEQDTSTLYRDTQTVNVSLGFILSSFNPRSGSGVFAPLAGATFTGPVAVPDPTTNTGAENVESVRSLKGIAALDTGTANTYAVALSPALAAYATWDKVVFKAANANTGASTLNVNGLGTKAIQKDAAALTSGMIVAGQIVVCIYDGTQFQMISS